MERKEFENHAVVCKLEHTLFFRTIPPTTATAIYHPIRPSNFEWGPKTSRCKEMRNEDSKFNFEMPGILPSPEGVPPAKIRERESRPHFPLPSFLPLYPTLLMMVRKRICISDQRAYFPIPEISVFHFSEFISINLSVLVIM